MAFTAALAAAPAPVLADDYDGDWHFSTTPYLWLAGSDTSLRFRMPDGVVARTTLNASPVDVLKHLHFGFFGFADVRKGEWSAFSDLMYVSLGDSATIAHSVTLPNGGAQIPIDLHASVGLQEFAWTAGLGYAVLHDGQSSADVVVGLRAAATNTSINWKFAGPPNLFPPTGRVSRYESSWDGIIGVRGRIGFAGSPWFVPYYADLGTGEAHLTSQALTGVGYGFSWGDLLLTYRWLYYQPERGGTLDKLALHGFMLGTTLRF